MEYELWYSEAEDSYLFISKDENYKTSIRQNKIFSPDIVLTWSYLAKSHFEAMQAYYDYLGYGQYKPEPEWEDTFY